MGVIERIRLARNTLGANLLQVLRSMIPLVATSNNVEFAIIGAVILVGVIADEIARRIAAGHPAA